MALEPKLVRAPDSPPLAISALRGSVVLVDFWDYTCVNCIRTLPYLREWHRRYSGKGLTIIGVHAPEFAFARSAENVSRAAEEFGLDYPIVQDNGYKAWEAFANHAWPSEYLVDKDGYIRYRHTGEGDYRETEAAIQELLRERDPAVELPSLMDPVRAADAPGAVCPRPTPEIDLGTGRPRAGAVEFSGDWVMQPDYAEVAGQPSILRLPYEAAEVNLVADGTGELEILDNGLALDHQSRGAHVREAQDGSTWVHVREPRMYSLVRRDRFLSRVLELSSSSAGLRLYAFTFSSCVPRP